MILLHRNSDICYLSSIQNFPGPITIDKEFLGFGNSGTEEPYQKVLVGEQRFEKLLHDAKVSQQEELIEDLIDFLKQEERYVIACKSYNFIKFQKSK